jgi:hypothetical protein
MPLQTSLYAYSTQENRFILPLNSPEVPSSALEDSLWSWGVDLEDQLIFEFDKPPIDCDYQYFKYLISEKSTPKVMEEPDSDFVYTVYAEFYYWDYNGTLGRWISGEDMRGVSGIHNPIGKAKVNAEILLSFPEFPLVFPKNYTFPQLLGDGLDILHDIQDLYTDEIMFVNVSDTWLYIEIIESTFDLHFNLTLDPLRGVLNFLDIKYLYDDSNILDFIFHSIDSKDIAGNHLPTAKADVKTSKNEVEFSSISESIDPITEYLWQFGDGVNATSSSFVHHYNITGIYNASLTVWDSNGDFSKTNFQVEITSVKTDLSIPGYAPRFLILIWFVTILELVNWNQKKKIS